MDRKEIIINVARKHFSRYGYSKTTMEEIARDCKITKPTLYNHFAGKTDLFKAVIASEQNACYGLIEQSVQTLGSASAKLSAYADMQVQSLKKFLLLGELSRQAFLDLHPDVLKVYNIYRVKEESLISGWIDEGIRTKEFTITDISLSARVFYLTIAALKYDALVIQNENSDDISAEDKIIESLSTDISKFVGLFLNGLKRRDTAS